MNSDYESDWGPGALSGAARIVNDDMSDALMRRGDRIGKPAGFTFIDDTFGGEPVGSIEELNRYGVHLEPVDEAVQTARQRLVRLFHEDVRTPEQVIREHQMKESGRNGGSLGGKV